MVFCSDENSMWLKPPNTVAYWSCQPPGMLSISRSAWKAISAISCRSHRSERNSLKQPMMADDTTAEPPRPEPTGKSSRDVEIEAVSRLDQADDRFDQRQLAFAAEACEIVGFDRAAKIMRVDPDPVVVASPQRRMRIHRNGRVDDGAAVIVDEVMREVGAAAGETDADRRAGAGKHFALLAEIEQIAAEHVDQAAVGIEDRDDMNPLVEQLEDLFAGRAGARPDEVAVDAARHLALDRHSRRATAGGCRRP